MNWLNQILLVFLVLISAVFFYFYLRRPTPSTVVDLKVELPAVKQEKWQPKGKIETSKDYPETKAKAIFLLDATSQKIIIDKYSQNQLPIASLSKLMTATLVLQLGTQEKVLAVTGEATACGESAMGLLAGESCSIKELLYGLILNSGNDAAEVLAANIAPGGRQQFIDWMNQKAGHLALEETKFINPTGLDEDQKGNLSSARDLASLYFYLEKNFPLFREIFTTPEYLTSNIGHRQLYLFNTAWNFTNSYPYLIGAKSGNTDLAGYCLLGLAKKKNNQLLLIILGEPTYLAIREESRKLFDFGFAVLENQ